MIGPYIQAVETQMRWARLAASNSLNLEKWPSYCWPLLHADTFYMDAHFCRLAHHASEAIPFNTEFDSTWLQSPSGWLYMEETIPQPDGGPDMRALGWRINADQVEVVTYRELEEGFYPLSHHTIPMKGEYLSVIEKCEREQNPDDPNKNIIKVMCWVWAAFHLMSKRLTVTVNQRVDRAVRRRSEKQGQRSPDIVKVITLRRMEEARKREAPHDVSWHWQWEVRGHWRNQFYPSENIHKAVFVEAYIKGPPNMPFKAPGLKLFAAVR